MGEVFVEGFGVSVSKKSERLVVKRKGEVIFDPQRAAERIAKGRIDWFGRSSGWTDLVGFRGEQDVESADGKWTRIEVICDGDQITQIVNGKVVNKAEKCSQSRGRITFQSEGAEIYFRRIELTPLR